MVSTNQHEDQMTIFIHKNQSVQIVGLKFNILKKL
jgi:hypothetical protein